MDSEQTIEQQLLAHAESQTEALQSLRLMAFLWSLLAAIGLVVWLVRLMSGAGILA